MGNFARSARRALSLAQLEMDASLQADWSGIVGNVSKFLLGNVTVLFDLVFIYQHYWLYRPMRPADKPGPSEQDPLLESRMGYKAKYVLPSFWLGVNVE